MSEPAALQAERTVMAWSRTVLVIAAAGALIARTADSGFERGAAITLASVGLALAVLVAIRRRRGLTADSPVAAAANSTFGLLLSGLAALGAAGVVVIL